MTCGPAKRYLEQGTAAGSDDYEYGHGEDENSIVHIWSASRMERCPFCKPKAYATHFRKRPNGKWERLQV